MKLYIQINFGSGLGDFFAHFCEVYFFSKKMKEKGYSMNLIIHTKNKINFRTLFQEKYYEVFDNFEVKQTPTRASDFIDYKVLNSDDDSVGIHQWELFTPIEYTEPFDFIRFNLAQQVNYEDLYDFPKLSENITKEIDSFISEKNLDDFVVIHFRELDDVADNYNHQILQNNLESVNFNQNYRALEKVEDIINNNKKVFVCSNNVKIKLMLSERYPNVIIYNDNVQKIIHRTYSDEEYLNHCITEFYILSKAKKIFSFGKYVWISNFLIYGLIHFQETATNPNNLKHNNFEFCGEF
jgi:hypothetical protein